MGDDEISPREKLLRLIAAAAPQPWFAREYGEQTRYPLDILLNDLEDLWLEGLLRKGETTAKSAGLLLSPAGEEVLRDPGALLRLREGEPLRPGDRGCVARSLFRLERRRSVTRLFLWLNLLWFGWGFYLAQSRHQAGREFLTVQGNANAAMVQVWHQIGSVSAADLIHGEWWRLLSSCFVHFGLLHLAFTVLWLYTLGARAELLWGRWRFFVIYSLAGSYSTALPMAYRPGTLSGEPRQFVPDLVGGASGALCGLLGAELVWLLFNGRFLPRRIVRRWWFGLALSVLILGALNAFSNVSAVGQIGALVVGAVAATLLTVQGFGPTSVRWLTLLVLAGLLWASYALIERQRATSAVWVEAEKQVYQHDFSARARETLAEGSKAVSCREPRAAKARRIESRPRARRPIPFQRRHCHAGSRLRPRGRTARRGLVERRYAAPAPGEGGETPGGRREAADKKTGRGRDGGGDVHAKVLEPCRQHDCCGREGVCGAGTAAIRAKSYGSRPGSEESARGATGCAAASGRGLGGGR